MKTKEKVLMFQRTIALVTLWIFLCSNVSFALRPVAFGSRQANGKMPVTNLHRLNELGTAPWYDGFPPNIEEWLAKGTLGVTTNPSIVKNKLESLAKKEDKTELVTVITRAIEKVRAEKGLGPDVMPDVADIYFALVEDDIKQMADKMRSLWERTDGKEGYVSIEVNPQFAFKKGKDGKYDEDGEYNDTMEQGIRFARLAPNVMIKVPATPGGIRAIRDLTALGVNVNVTLVFSVEQDEEVLEAHSRGAEIFLKTLDGKTPEAREAQKRLVNRNPRRLSSDRSFFASRPDTHKDYGVDKIIDDKGLDKRMKGRTGVALSKLAHTNSIKYLPVYEGLMMKGIRPQRLLLASTACKYAKTDPHYHPLLYVAPLVGSHEPGEDNINTLPEPTIIEILNSDLEFRSTISEPLTVDKETGAIVIGPTDRPTETITAEEAIAELTAAGIDLEEVGRNLLRDGAAAFTADFEKTLEVIRQTLPLLQAQPAVATPQRQETPAERAARMRAGELEDLRQEIAVIDGLLEEAVSVRDNLKPVGPRDENYERLLVEHNSRVERLSGEKRELQAELRKLEAQPAVAAPQAAAAKTYGPKKLTQEQILALPSIQTLLEKYRAVDPKTQLEFLSEGRLIIRSDAAFPLEEIEPYYDRIIFETAMVVEYEAKFQPAPAPQAVQFSPADTEDLRALLGTQHDLLVLFFRRGELAADEFKFSQSTSGNLNRQLRNLLQKLDPIYVSESGTSRDFLIGDFEAQISFALEIIEQEIRNIFTKKGGTCYWTELLPGKQLAAFDYLSRFPDPTSFLIPGDDMILLNTIAYAVKTNKAPDEIVPQIAARFKELKLGGATTDAGALEIAKEFLATIGTAYAIHIPPKAQVGEASTAGAPAIVDEIHRLGRLLEKLESEIIDLGAVAEEQRKNRDRIGLETTGGRIGAKEAQIRDVTAELDRLKAAYPLIVQRVDFIKSVSFYYDTQDILIEWYKGLIGVTDAKAIQKADEEAQTKIAECLRKWHRSYPADKALESARDLINQARQPRALARGPEGRAGEMVITEEEVEWIRDIPAEIKSAIIRHPAIQAILRRGINGEILLEQLPQAIQDSVVRHRIIEASRYTLSRSMAGWLTELVSIKIAQRTAAPAQPVGVMAGTQIVPAVKVPPTATAPRLGVRWVKSGKAMRVAKGEKLEIIKDKYFLKVTEVSGEDREGGATDKKAILVWEHRVSEDERHLITDVVNEKGVLDLEEAGLRIEVLDVDTKEKMAILAIVPLAPSASAAAPQAAISPVQSAALLGAI